jgi:hypothetical protein
MPASIVRLKGKWYVLITTFDVHHRGEAEEIVSAKLSNKHYPARIFPMDSWGDAAMYGNALADEFLTDWSMRPYTSVVNAEGLVKDAIAKKQMVLKTRAVRPEWKDKLDGMKGKVKPSVKVTVKKKKL